MMIAYRKITSDRFIEAKNYCLSRKIGFPENSEAMFGAFDETGNVVGICALKKVYMVEPLIADTPLVAHILSEKVMAIASLITNQVMAIVSDDKVDFVNQLEKTGFIVTDKSMTILHLGV